jgi:hypothetical protein
MPNLPSAPDTDPLPEQGTTPYFRAAVDAEAARRGLPPEPWAA